MWKKERQSQKCQKTERGRGNSKSESGRVVSGVNEKRTQSDKEERNVVNKTKTERARGRRCDVQKKEDKGDKKEGER